MRKSVMIGSAGVLLVLFLDRAFFAPDLKAQNIGYTKGPHYTFACRFLYPGDKREAVDESAPEEEREYNASTKEFHRVWCTAAVSSARDRKRAAETMAERWKRLWYRDTPFNAAFHETGSLELLVLIAITRRVPKPLVADPVFMQDWLADCKDRCFMIYGDDDPGAKDEMRRFLRLRNDVLEHLKKEPAAELVKTMLKNAKLDPVN